MTKRSLEAFYRSLKHNGPERVYYFVGTEDVLKDEAVVELLDRTLDPGVRDFNYDQVEAAKLEPEGVADLCNTLPMMAERRVVVIRGVEAWKRKTRAKKAVTAYLADPAPETVLVMVQNGTDEKLDKALEQNSYVVDFQELTPEQTLRWLDREGKRQQVEFDAGAAEHLIAVTAGLGSLRSEVAKLAALSPDAPITIDQVGDLVGVHHGETVLDWCDAVLRGDTDRAAAMIEPILNQSGMTAVRMVTPLGTSLVGLGLARSHLDAGRRGGALVNATYKSIAPARPFGLGSWKAAASKWASCAPDWPEPRIRAAIQAARAADERLKMTRLSDDHGVLTELVFELASGVGAGA